MGAMAVAVLKPVWLETIILCAGGGLIGTGLALLTARLTDVLVRNLLPYSPSGGLVAIDLKLVLMTLGVVTAIGLASGIYPSWKAARMRPLATIRSEEESGARRPATPARRTISP